MTINADALLNQTMLNAFSNVPKAVSTATDFQTELHRQLIDNLKSTEDTTKTTKSDAAVEEFKRELASMGAANYLQEQNAKKIEELLAKKKEELMGSLGLRGDKNPPLSGTEQKTALETLDELLSDYKKQLLEQMQASSKTNSQANTTTLSSLLEKL